ncbi:LacI family DNA-binding transcriptional regulator [Gorillibacterium massiliense]|uniref:LacI family DNA-binding transcriptional regulator n=1 Tax=Gorillibacterium massiliense TaxID=1280390 RepID=UPI0004BC16ED|nr:LacI family DNA-binding transcriptional regulator [Gorillibacterium massiliense]
MSNKITMQHVADAAGVSKYVVSKSLSGKPGVNAGTKEHVRQTAVKLGYQFTPRSGGKTRQDGNIMDKQTIVVLLPNVRGQFLDSLYWGRIVEGITQELRTLDASGIVITDQTVESFLSMVDKANIHGFIGVGEIDTGVLQEVSRLNVPIVLIDHDDSLVVSSQLFVNNRECVYQLTNHLISLGHRDIRFVGNTGYSISFMNRWDGFRDAMEEGGLQIVGNDPLCKLRGDTRIEHEVEIGKILEADRAAGNLPTALVCANDAIAVCAMNVMDQMNIQVPDDISITGFDNIEDSYTRIPGITTVNVEKEILGKRAVHMLLEKMKYTGFPRESIYLSASIIYRGSIGKMKKEK